MADNDLKKRLKGIFADLEKPLKPVNTLELTESDDEENQEDEYQLEKLFSRAEDSFPPSKPIKPPIPVEIEFQQLPPIIGTPPVHQAKLKKSSSEPEDSSSTSKPIIPPPKPAEMEFPQPQPSTEISPAFEEDPESLFPEPEEPFPSPEPPTPEAEPEILSSEPEEHFSFLEPPAPGEIEPTSEAEPEILPSEPEDPFRLPDQPIPFGVEPSQPLPIAKRSPIIKKEPKKISSGSEDPFRLPDQPIPFGVEPSQSRPVAKKSPIIKKEPKKISSGSEDPFRLPDQPIPFGVDPSQSRPVAKRSPIIKKEPKKISSGSEDPFRLPDQPIPFGVDPSRPQPVAKTPPIIKKEPKKLVPKSSQPEDRFRLPDQPIPFGVEPSRPQPVVEVLSEEVTAKTEKVEELTFPSTFEDDVVKLLKATEASERREAVQNLAQTHNEWSIDPLLYAATDKDQEVARLAVEGLLEMSVAVKARVLGLPQEYQTPLHLGAAAFISRLVGQPFVYIAPGPFLMGSDPAQGKSDDSNESLQHELSLPGYWIARYPVTISQFQTFLDESGYGPSQDNNNNKQGDYPVIDVTWKDALAYCLWLTQKTGLKATLPSEAEWEKAARGTDGRSYPWGDEPPTAALYNPDKLTPVGQYSPQADSPYGCSDMAGNVWEWTRTIYKSYPYNPKDGRENLEGHKARVIRGLAFNNPEKFAHCAARYRLKPVLHLRTLGFRVVISPT